ncbi:MAG: HNH endonuclease [Verrucomicrobiales bacterium]
MKICPLCQREIPPELESRHHLTPKLRGGTHGPIAVLHSTCHSKIHSVFTETELARRYNSIDKVLTNHEIQTFVRWIQRRPIDFADGSRSRRRQIRR